MYLGVEASERNTASLQQINVVFLDQRLALGRVQAGEGKHTFEGEHT